MIQSNLPIYLASNSPRRKDMLQMMRINFQIIKIDYDESINSAQSPIKNVKRLALEKCNFAENRIDNGIIISADTIVVLQNKIIGKPKNKPDAIDILSLLSDKSHHVYTGYSIKNTKTGRFINDYSKTKVFFRKLLLDEIEEYVNSGSPMDKAGAYGIQDDFGAVFVKKIVGCYYNVLGFPVPKIYDGLNQVI